MKKKNYIEIPGFIEDTCKGCKYCHKLKELVNHEWVIRSVCTYFPETEKGYEAFAIVVDPEWSHCECYTRR